MPDHDATASALHDLAPAVRTSLTDAVADQLADAIVERELGPGARLPGERDLALQFRVSRIVVREALVRLAQRGLVEIRPGVGTFVARLAETSVTEPLRLYLRRHRVGQASLFEVRGALEPAIAAAASRAATDAQLAGMAANLERTFALVDATDRDEGAVEAFAWADLEFHQLLAASSGNPLFELLLAPLIDRLLDVRRRGARLPGTARRAAEGHRAVFEAVAGRDAALASARMVDHLHDVERWLEQDVVRQPALAQVDPTPPTPAPADDPAPTRPEEAP
jgi:GntR family transcriptional regulator, transcriptional repressor for pyruvate dehydrogenase complex